MPIISPWPRISTTPATPASSRSSPALSIAPTSAALASRPSSSMIRERLDAGAHRQRVAAEGRAVVARAEHAGRARAADDGADRHARAEALGERHHVGPDAGPLVREPLAGAAHAALHLVEHQQPAALVADPARFLEVRRPSSAGCRLRPGSPRGTRRRRSGWSRATFSSAATSFSGTRTKPSTSGPKPACILALPVADSVAIERPWKAAS